MFLLTLPTGYTMPAVDVDFQEVYATFEANFFGVMRMCQTFAPLLIDAKGAIVQIGSVAAVMPFVFGCELTISIWGLCTLEVAGSYVSMLILSVALGSNVQCKQSCLAIIL